MAPPEAAEVLEELPVVEVFREEEAEAVAASVVGARQFLSLPTVLLRRLGKSGAFAGTILSRYTCAYYWSKKIVACLCTVALMLCNMSAISYQNVLWLFLFNPCFHQLIH